MYACIVLSNLLCSGGATVEQSSMHLSIKPFSANMGQEQKFKSNAFTISIETSTPA
jgi:hypothetical protein